MADEPFSLDQLYQAIEQHLVTQLPGVQTVSAWPNIEDRIPLPAVFLELAEIEPGVDIGTGETTLACKFEARIIVDPIRPFHQQQAVQLATQLAVILRAQTWGLPVEPAEFVQAMQDWTQPVLDGYTVWLVEWTQQVYVGPEEWPWPDQPPGMLLFGFNEDVKADFVPPEDL
ncbi:hypothetical protein BK666_19905 [Pseudomonas frederiksbergensis]|uniref:Phage tail protein n=1 Tax=Pseudomonas frederiksbergensis TaxID=104087 RepID=A0A423JZH1_9PSED|nr:hypothetical protein [Pseudomonas frederiksbergensis]RON43356.1 hypothetical protein BK666_19905 [Pseudomonas frederiksbergensis]